MFTGRFVCVMIVFVDKMITLSVQCHVGSFRGLRLDLDVVDLQVS